MGEGRDEPAHARSGRDTFTEPLSSYISRKHSEIVLAALVCVPMLLVDLSVLLGAMRGPDWVFVLFNSLLLAAVSVLIWMGRQKSQLRRYEASDEGVTMPVSESAGYRFPSRMSIGNIRGLRVTPAKPPRDLLPAIVHLTILEKTEGGTAPERVVHLSMRADDFGYRNLKDLVRRLPAELMDAKFARQWREIVLSRA